MKRSPITLDKSIPLRQLRAVLIGSGLQLVRERDVTRIVLAVPVKTSERKAP